MKTVWLVVGSSHLSGPLYPSWLQGVGKQPEGTRCWCSDNKATASVQVGIQFQVQKGTPKGMVADGVRPLLPAWGCHLISLSARRGLGGIDLAKRLMRCYGCQLAN